MRKAFPPFAAVLYVLVFLVPIVSRPLATADEARYAEIPREMLASGDWVAPRLNGLRYFEKPPLGYWLVALSIKAFGENNFAVRLPSALSAGMTALLIGWLLRRHTRDLDWARLAPVLYLTSLLAVVVGATNVLDGPFSFFLTAAIACFFFADQESASARQTGFLALFGLCCGLAFLAKGFLGFVVPAVVIGPYLAWSRNWKGLFQFPALPIAVAAAVILPWAIAIHLREPDYWRYFVVEEHLRRFAAEDAQHAEPFWYFGKILALGLLPWIFVVPAALLGWQRKFVAEPVVRFALCWFAMPFLFFSASSGKLGTYILPCFPPLAMLLSRGLVAYYRDQGRQVAFTRGTILLAGLLVAAMAVISLVQFAPWFTSRLYAQEETGEWVILLVAGLAWAGLLAASAGARSPARKLALFAAAPVLVYSIVGVTLPYRVKAVHSAEAFLTKHASRIPADSLVISDDKRAHSACWFLRRDDLFLIGDGEFAYGLSYPEARYRSLDTSRLAALLAPFRGNRRVTLITARERWTGFAPLLPPPDFLECEGPDVDKRALVIVQFD